MTDTLPEGSMSRKSVIGYGLPGFVTAIPIIPIAILLPSFYASELGLGFTLTGIALGLARLIDFFSDIVIGLAVDRVHWTKRDGSVLHFKPWLITGGVIAAIGLFALARPTAFDNAAAGAIYLGAWSCVLFLGWTCVMVPYTAWGAVLAEDTHGRSRLTVAREAAGLVGMLIALTAPIAVLNYSITPLTLISALAIIAGVPLFAYTILRVPESFHKTAAANPDKVALSDIGQLLRFRPYRFTVICWFLNSLANGLPAVLFPIVAMNYLGFDEKGLFILLFLYFGAGVLAASVWLNMAKRFSKISAWQVAMVLNISVFSLVLFIDPQSSGLFGSSIFYAICCLSGLSLAADMALPASLQADVMAADRLLHHKERTATAFALWSMATKLALAAAVTVGFVSLGSAGENFDATDDNAKWLLLTLYVCVPVALKIGVITLLRRFPFELLEIRKPAR